LSLQVRQRRAAPQLLFDGEAGEAVVAAHGAADQVPFAPAARPGPTSAGSPPGIRTPPESGATTAAAVVVTSTNRSSTVLIIAKCLSIMPGRACRARTASVSRRRGGRSGHRQVVSSLASLAVGPSTYGSPYRSRRTARRSSASAPRLARAAPAVFFVCRSADPILRMAPRIHSFSPHPGERGGRRTPRRNYARIPFTTFPFTSVSRTSRPA
jgi:hypothetical protein